MHCLIYPTAIILASLFELWSCGLSWQQTKNPLVDAGSGVGFRLGRRALTDQDYRFYYAATKAQ